MEVFQSIYWDSQYPQTSSILDRAVTIHEDKTKFVKTYFLIGIFMRNQKYNYTKKKFL